MFQRLRKHLSFSNAVALFALFIALGGSAYAVGKNTIGTKQIKNNAVTAKKIKKDAVVTAKIKNNAVTAGKIKDGSITAGKIPAGSIDGSKIDLATLGTVPSATSATSANTAASAAALTGQTSSLVKLAGSQTVELAKNGAVSIIAQCIKNNMGDDEIRLAVRTTVNGAVFDGNDSKSGGPNPTDFLNIDTPEDERDFVSYSDDTGVINVGTSIDQGFILGPDGKGIVVNSEGLILGLNYLGSDCIVGGVFNNVG